MKQPELRRDYLAALGLDTWVRRHGPAGASVPAQTVPVVAAPAAVVSPTAAPPSAVAEAPQSFSRPPLPVKSVKPARVAKAVAVDIDIEREADADWSELRLRVAACTRCTLSATRTQTVFGVGNASAEWLVIGEAPGAEEDRQGEPFVGRAGQLLNAMLRAIGLPREQVYIANVLKCRPPSNRDPAPAEAAECLPFLHRQIALIKPKILLVVGRIAAQSLLRVDTPLGKLRQQAHSFGASQLPLIVTYHPAYLLRSPGEKRKAWEDLKFAREVAARV